MEIFSVYMIIQKFEVGTFFNVFDRSLLCSPRLQFLFKNIVKQHNCEYANLLLKKHFLLFKTVVLIFCVNRDTFFQDIEHLEKHFFYLVTS